LEAVHEASHQISCTEGNSGLNDLLELFGEKCEDFTGLLTLLSATYSYKDDLPYRESFFIKVRDNGYSTFKDEDLVDGMLKGLD